MSDQSGSSNMLVLFEAALEDYKHQTGIELAEHPLAKCLQNCNSVESVTTVLRKQAQDFQEFRDKDKVLRPLKKILTVLHGLTSAAKFAQLVGFKLHFPPVKAIQTGLGILLTPVKGVLNDYSALANLLESIGRFLYRLEIYTKIPPTESMNEIIVKILVELLYTLALTTKETKQGKLKSLVQKLVGENKMEAMVQRLDRLTQEEARQTVAQTLEVVHGLVENMKVVMKGGEISFDHLKETLENMNQVISDLNKAKRDSLQKDIFGWLSPPDPWKNHHAACKSRHPGTAEWFIHGNTFSEWRTSEEPGSLLWVHGKPGAGKSVFCSTIIEDVHAMRKAGLASLAFFYCDFREDRKKELGGLLSSFLVQLYHQSNSYFDILSDFYSEHDQGSRPPSDDALVGCLKDLLELPGLAPVYLIIDGLDECPKPSSVRSPRAEVLSLIEKLVKMQIRNLRVCVTSRPEPDIKDVLDPLIFRSVSLHDESGHKLDIEDYIKSVINKRTITGRWNEEYRKLAIDDLKGKANGMFMWVDCQLVHICDCTPAGIRGALAELPETLDKTYERTLRGINRAKWEIAHRMFQFVSVASRPLHVKELADLFAFDFEAGSIPKFRNDWRVEDPADAVLSTCSTLLAIVNDRGSPVVQFSHFSVKEFLTSTRLAETTDVNSRRYHVSMTPAHTLVAQACLGILLHLDKDVTSDSLEDFPLAEYAAEHWVYHARFDVSQNVEDGMKQLFDPSKPHLAICAWIYDPTFPDFMMEKGRYRTKEPAPLPRTFLHYAAFWGLHLVVESLIINHQQGVCSRDFSNLTPLHLASRNGHMEAACKLIKNGASLTAEDSHGSTPLHLASRNGHMKIACKLIEHGASLTAEDSLGSTPLHLASEMGQVDVARMLIERPTCLTAQNIYGSTPLHLASKMGQVDVARVLIERGADLTAQNHIGQTPLRLALGRRQVDVARMLIEHGADLTARSNYGETPLHLASQMGQVAVVGMLIERCVDLTALNHIGQTPLHLALQGGQIDVARMLIECGADLTAQSDNGETLLHIALEMGQVDIARMLIERSADAADLTAQKGDGSTPLDLALKKGQVDVARMLIEHGVDPTAQNHIGQTPLHLASQMGQVDIARMFVEHGADLTAQNHYGFTPLHLALLSGKVNVARMLLEHGADLTAHNHRGETPLLFAAQTGLVDVACMLIERGAYLITQNNDRSTLLHLVLQGGQVDVAHMLIERATGLTAENNYRETSLRLASRMRQEDVADILIKRGANQTTQNDDGSTLSHLALQMGQVNVVCMLIEHGADLTTQNDDGSTLLHLASQMGQVNVAHMLIEHGADLTSQNHYGQTPLHLALQRGQVDVARMLIDRGTDRIVRNNYRETQLHLAAQIGQIDVTGILIDRGAKLSAQNYDGETPLHLALQKGQVDVARMLIECATGLTVQDNYGETPLHLALRMGQLDVVRMLIERRAGLTVRNNFGQTPSHLASQMGQVDIVRMLIERGADVTAKNQNN